MCPGGDGRASRKVFCFSWLAAPLVDGGGWRVLLAPVGPLLLLGVDDAAPFTIVIVLFDLVGFLMLLVGGHDVMQSAHDLAWCGSFYYCYCSFCSCWVLDVACWWS
jgi:hypothetical protein